MQLTLANKEEWIQEQLDIIREEFNKNPVKLVSEEAVSKWLDSNDLIQVLTENFDYTADFSDVVDFSNEEFAKQFVELFQSLKNEIINKFLKQI